MPSRLGRGRAQIESLRSAWSAEDSPEPEPRRASPASSRRASPPARASPSPTRSPTTPASRASSSRGSPRSIDRKSYVSLLTRRSVAQELLSAENKLGSAERVLADTEAERAKMRALAEQLEREGSDTQRSLDRLQEVLRLHCLRLKELERAQSVADQGEVSAGDRDAFTRDGAAGELRRLFDTCTAHPEAVDAVDVLALVASSVGDSMEQLVLRMRDGSNRARTAVREMEAHVERMTASYAEKEGEFAYMEAQMGAALEQAADLQLRVQQLEGALMAAETERDDLRHRLDSREEQTRRYRQFVEAAVAKRFGYVPIELTHPNFASANY